MSISLENNFRTVCAVHGRREIEPDALFELDLSKHLSESYSPAVLLEQYTRFAVGDGELDSLMRRAISRALTRKFGNGVRISSGVNFRHLETFEIGDGVFIGAQAFIQGRFDVTTKIGNHVWIGPQAPERKFWVQLTPVSRSTSLASTQARRAAFHSFPASRGRYSGVRGMRSREVPFDRKALAALPLYPELRLLAERRLDRLTVAASNET